MTSRFFDSVIFNKDEYQEKKLDMHKYAKGLISKIHLRDFYLFTGN